MSTLSRYVILRTSGRVLLLLAVFLVLIAGGQIGAAVGKGVPLLAILPTFPSIIMLALPIAIPLSLAAGILVSVGTMHRDGEFRVFAASGIPAHKVITHLWPMVLIAILVTNLLTHYMLPKAMFGLRSNQERYAQAALAHRVNNGRPLYRERGSQAFALHASGDRLQHVFLSEQSEETTIALYASGAHWYLGTGDNGDGLGLELEDVRLLRREADGRISLATTPTAQFPIEKGSATKDQLGEPDTWSTAALLSFVNAGIKDDHRADFNNARLSLHLRIFIPISLIAFTFFAAGLGLRRGGSDSLTAVIIIIAIVALSTTPALFYTKNAVDHLLISPAWLLWPQASIVGALGLWWILHPDLANDRGGPKGPGRITALFHRASASMRRLTPRAKMNTALTAPTMPNGGILSVLTRIILRPGINTWIAVLFIGTFLVVVGQTLGRIGLYVRAIAHRPVEMVEFFVYSLPEFIALWIPLSVGAAALLVASPLLRRGNLMVLSASGIPLRRVFIPMMWIALVACVAKFTLDDQVNTRLGPIAADREDAMWARDTSSNTNFKPAGWEANHAFWLSGSADSLTGRYGRVASFTGSPTAGRALMAKELIWDTEHHQWTLNEVVAVSPGGKQQQWATATLDQLQWPLLPERADLAFQLLPDSTKSSDQLIAGHSPIVLEVIVTRVLTALTPFFALLLALPGFVRFDNRTRIAQAIGIGAMWCAVPVGIIALTNRAILSSQGQPLVTAIIVVGALSIFGGVRWWRMAP